MRDAPYQYEVGGPGWVEGPGGRSICDFYWETGQGFSPEGAADVRVVDMYGDCAQVSAHLQWTPG